MIGLMEPPGDRHNGARLVMIPDLKAPLTGVEPSAMLWHGNPCLEGSMNRRFEVHQYRQVLLCMRQGETDRSIARTGLMGRVKAGILRRLAEEAGFLDPLVPLPEDSILAEKLIPIREGKPSTSSVAPFAEVIKEWAGQGIQATTIFEALRRDKGFGGHYSSVRRFVR